MFKLVNEDDWSLNESLQEFGVVRPDVENLLAGRARLMGDNRPRPDKGRGRDRTRKPPQPRPAPYDRPQWEPKGGKEGKKGKGKGKEDKEKGKGKGSMAEAFKQFKKNWAQKDEAGKGICAHFHTIGCKRGDSCRYSHACPIPTGNGNFCFENHAASSCPSKR